MLSAVALLSVGGLTSTPTQARDGSGFAAGMFGGLAAGALIGASTRAYAAPVYYARPARRVVVEDVECRTIVKRRYNGFGDLVIRRVRVCD